jgi:predicted nucleic-acid-binding protein
MIAVDTNIVVRLLTQDDANQYQKAYTLFNQHDVFIADSVILETEWVLRFAYQFDAGRIADALAHLFGLPNVHVNQPSMLAQAITWHRQGLDFADAFHLASSQQCKTFFTFDKKMVKAAKGVAACDVLSP